MVVFSFSKQFKIEHTTQAVSFIHLKLLQVSDECIFYWANLNSGNILNESLSDNIIVIILLQIRNYECNFMVNHLDRIITDY